MKISKIFLFTAAALALCGACDDSDDKVDPSTTEDKISISPTEGVVGSKGGDVSTMVTSSGEWTLEGAENAYVTPSAAKGKDGDIVAFTVKANDKEEDQVFTYTFACGKKTAPFKITLKKKASETEEQLELFYAEESNIIPREGGKVTVLVTSSGAWTLEGTADFVHPLTVNIKISQKSKGLIECVADMRRARCYFPYLKNANALNGLKNGAMEALVNIQDTRVAGSLSTIMGIEGKFLLRLGDVGVPWNQIQLAMSGGNRTDAKLELSELDRWYHVAVTWDDTFAYFYVDGELLYQAGISNYFGFNLGVAYGGSESDWNRAFWIGYAYNADRFFPGYMAEVRVWNRTLTKEEINAENHFYSVPVDSEGLVGYWKLNDGAGAIVKDSSPSGNDMVGEINVRSSNGQQIGDEGMNWVEMSLP